MLKDTEQQQSDRLIFRREIHGAIEALGKVVGFNGNDLLFGPCCRVKL
jgi:hypothetical protein